MELGWSPDTFWRGATVPEFWAACDWLAERNLDQEDEIEAARSRAHEPRDPGERVVVNPDLRVEPNPAFVAWREELRVRHGI